MIRGTFSRSVTALAVCALALTGCPTGNWGLPPAGTTQANLAPCSSTTSVFSTTGVAQTFATVDLLPTGTYAPANFETYIENNVAPTNGSQSGDSKVQAIETYTGGTAASGTSSLRCRENTGVFFAYGPVALTVPVSMTHNADGTFTVAYRTINLSFVSATNAQTVFTDGGSNANLSPNDFSNQLTRTWTSGFNWVRRSGETYEFHGRAVSGNRSVMVKSTLSRH